jgi:DNA-binding XRE family transcriptional regulator
LGAGTQVNEVYPCLRLYPCDISYSQGTTMRITTALSEKSTAGAEARRLRIACLLTQQNLADMAGISREQVDLLEHNYPVPLDSRRRIFRELWAIKTKK